MEQTRQSFVLTVSLIFYLVAKEPGYIFKQFLELNIQVMWRNRYKAASESKINNNSALFSAIVRDSGFALFNVRHCSTDID